MRRLILFRHAKAERSHPGGGDHARVLDERGCEDAPRIGAYILSHRLIPDRVIVSTAARTRETWALAARTFPSAPPVDYDDRIYDATPQAILQVLRLASPDVATLLVVGHNPGLQELVSLLIATGDRAALEQFEDFPTAALAVIGFDAETWAGLSPHSGRLERFVTPKLIAATD
jgi:phosphohistidine phosphatase